MGTLGFSTAISTQGFCWKEPSAVEGFEWIELALGYCRDNSALTHKKNLMQLQADYTAATALGLQIWSVHLPYGGGMDLTAGPEMHETVLKNLKGYVDDTIGMNPRVYVAHAHGRGENILPEQRDELLENANRNVAALASYIAQRGAVLAIEGLPRTCIGNTAQECMRIIQNTQAKICFDVNHMMHDTHENFVKVTGGKICTVHLSDYAFEDEKHWVPGDGKIDWKEVVKLLERAGYTGPMMFEVKYRKDGVPPTLRDVREGFYRAIR